MESNYTAAAVERARRKTLILVFLADILLIIFTLFKGHPTIWSEFDKELNLWSFGKASQMIITAFVAYINYLLVSNNRSGQRSRPIWPWLFLAFAFVFMACDDMLIIHERSGHAIENSVHALSRQNITFYMDDLLEFAYGAAAIAYGLLFLRRLMPDRRTMRYYMYGVACLVIATCIGLSPAMKSHPFPMALIQFLHIFSVYMFLTSFMHCTAAEIISAIKPFGGAATTPSPSGAKQQASIGGQE